MRWGKRFKGNNGQSLNGGPEGIAYINSKLCKYIVTNTCHRGAGCSYSHDLQIFPCKYLHGAGFCKNGQECKFSHKILKNNEIHKFMQENEEFLLKTRSTQGKTNLSDFFEKYLEQKKDQSRLQTTTPYDAMILPQLMMQDNQMSQAQNPLLNMGMLQNQRGVIPNDLAIYNQQPIMNEQEGQEQFQQTQNILSQLKGVSDEYQYLQKMPNNHNQSQIRGINFGQPQQQLLSTINYRQAITLEQSLIQTLKGTQQLQEQSIFQQNNSMLTLLSLLGNQPQQQLEQQTAITQLQNLLINQQQFPWIQYQQSSLAGLQDSRTQYQFQTAQFLQSLNQLGVNDIQQPSNALNNLINTMVPNQQLDTFQQLQNYLNPVQTILNTLKQQQTVNNLFGLEQEQQLPINILQPNQLFGQDQLLNQLKQGGVPWNQFTKNQNIQHPQSKSSNQNANSTINPYDPRKKQEKKSKVALDLENLYNKLQKNKEASLQRALCKVSERGEQQTGDKPPKQSQNIQGKNPKTNQFGSISEDKGLKNYKYNQFQANQVAKQEEEQNRGEFFNSEKKPQTEQIKKSLKDRLVLS